jgi:hypothetical protein
LVYIINYFTFALHKKTMPVRLTQIVAAETDGCQAGREPQKTQKQTKKSQKNGEQQTYRGTEFRTHHLYDSRFTRTIGTQFGNTILDLGLYDSRYLYPKLRPVPMRRPHLVAMVAYTNHRLDRNDNMGQA